MAPVFTEKYFYHSAGSLSIRNRTARAGLMFRKIESGIHPGHVQLADSHPRDDGFQPHDDIPLLGENSRIANARGLCLN
jgi:hypothetical protein